VAQSEFPSPFRPSRTGFRVPSIPQALNLGKIKGALDAVGKEAGGIGAREKEIPGKKDYTLKLY
jgi:hypothetical protein